MNTKHFSPDVQEFLSLLARFQVRYLIVGGEAVIYHGYARLTGDIDFFYDLSEENSGRLFDCLMQFWGGSVPEISEPAEFLRPGLVLQYGRPPNRIDLINAINGVTFQEAWDSRIEEQIEIEDQIVPVYFIGLDALTLLTSKARFAPFLTPFLILLSVSLVFLIPLFNLASSEQSSIAAIRSGVRFLFPAMLSLGFLPFFFLRKFSISLLGRLEHLRLIALFRFFGFAYIFLLVLDVLLLAAYGQHISVIHPWQEALIDVFLGWLVTDIMIHAYWLNALDFEGFKELSKESLQTVIPHTSTSFKLLDSIDIRILQSVERSAGELSHVLLTGESIPEIQPW